MCYTFRATKSAMGSSSAGEEHGKLIKKEKEGKEKEAIKMLNIVHDEVERPEKEKIVDQVIELD